MHGRSTRHLGETAATLQADEGFGKVVACDDSRPVLELATGGKPGLVLHAGTGSFVAAQAPDGTLHYAGGTGWRFGDPGSGYDLGLLRAVTNAVKVPVIASGGAGEARHMVEAVTEGGADAVLAASIFHFGDVSISEVKAAMAAAGVPVRAPEPAA